MRAPESDHVLPSKTGFVGKHEHALYWVQYLLGLWFGQVARYPRGGDFAENLEDITLKTDLHAPSTISLDGGLWSVLIDESRNRIGMGGGSYNA